MTETPSRRPPLEVLIAGTGPAAVEAALALRALAEDRVRLTLLGPDEQLVSRAMSVAEPFAHAGGTLHPVAEIASDLGASVRRARLVAVEPDRRTVVVEPGETLTYDVLILAVGARPVPVLSGVTTFWGPGDVEAIHGLVQDVEEGYSHEVAFVVPPGVTWPLPLYELALQLSSRAWEMGMAPGLTFVTPEERPLGVFGAPAAEAVEELLRAGGVELLTGVYAKPTAGGVLTLSPGGRRLESRRVVALPRLTGPAIPGLPADGDGFVPVDRYGRVRGLNDVYAAGDMTDFPVKQGGLACQQADTVAAAVAADAGAPVEPEPFAPVLRGMLLTGAGARWLRRDARGDAGDDAAVAERPLWWPPTKIAGRHLAPYLAAREGRAEAAHELGDVLVERSLPERVPTDGRPAPSGR